ncbi:MAG TPA: NUDIX hydrolase [Caulobacteraceae bacterium]|nr:NUDIX hydrolase [Caulobacteraceae bacterium]
MGERPEWLKAHGKPWRRSNERIRFDNPWLAVREYDAVAPTGNPATYGMVHMKNHAIAVLPLHEDGTVTLVGQNRFVFGEYSWEIPEGGGPLGEAPLDAARRELREECGLEAADWRQILEVQLSNSLTDEKAFGFLATGLSKAETEPDETEDLALARVPAAQALEAALAGHIKDALTVAMLLRLHHMAVKGELESGLAANVLG